MPNSLEETLHTLTTILANNNNSNKPQPLRFGSAPTVAVCFSKERSEEDRATFCGQLAKLGFSVLRTEPPSNVDFSLPSSAAYEVSALRTIQAAGAVIIDNFQGVLTHSMAEKMLVAQDSHSQVLFTSPFLMPQFADSLYGFPLGHPVIRAFRSPKMIPMFLGFSGGVLQGPTALQVVDALLSDREEALTHYPQLAPFPLAFMYPGDLYPLLLEMETFYTKKLFLESLQKPTDHQTH